MNTFPKYYEQGDFIVHFAPAGCPAVPVLDALKRIRDNQSVLGVGVEKRRLPSKAKKSLDRKTLSV